MPILAVHGFQDNAASFDRLATAWLHRRDCLCSQLLALDLPGHGRSDWRASGAGYFIMDYVADVLAVADALGWDRFVILGHSLGAGIATLLGGARPDRLLSALLIDGLGPVSMAPAKGPSLAASALAERARATPPSREMRDLEEASAVRAASRIRIDRDSARVLCGRGTRSTAQGSIAWRADPRLGRPSLGRLTEDTVLAFIRAMSVPTLLVEADEGVLHSLPEGRYAARLAAHPKLTHESLPGRHHLHMGSAAISVADRSDAFLRAHLPPGSR